MDFIYYLISIKDEIRLSFFNIFAGKENKNHTKCLSKILLTMFKVEYITEKLCLPIIINACLLNHRLIILWMCLKHIVLKENITRVRKSAQTMPSKMSNECLKVVFGTSLSRSFLDKRGIDWERQKHIKSEKESRVESSHF